MTHVGAIILGVIEGLTEFIPVSSSGHLIIARSLLKLPEGGLAFDAVLQLSTACALVIYFLKDIVVLVMAGIRTLTGKPVLQTNKTLLSAILLGTIPAFVFGLLLEGSMETIFRNTTLVAFALLFGSLLMFLAQKFGKGDSVITVRKGILVGFFQCLALIPGVSRSGATISGGLFLGLTREEATRFSFLLSIPILFGAGLKKLFEVRSLLFTTTYGSALLLGSITSFVVGLLSIHFLLRYLKTHSLNVFIWYRVALAVFLLLVFNK